MKRIFTLLICSCFLNTNAQYYNKWMISANIGIDFNTSTPSVFSGGQVSPTHVDNSSTISDASGNLLFYTDGETVWNKNNIAMPNGTGLIGNYTAGQSALIVPIPCSSTKFVIFHVTQFSNPGYLNYSVVDLSLNSGLGDVVISQKNISLGSGWTEKLCAYYNNSSNSYWVLTHRWGTNDFVAFKVDVSTIAITTVTSSIGSVHSCSVASGGPHDAMGQLTISPDGSKVINALTCADKYEVFDFNSSSGILSNSISLPGDGNRAWGTAFSPDSKKAYGNSIFGPSIYQYDLSVYTQTAVASSKFAVYTVVSPPSYPFGYIELGPDGKIYVPRPNTSFFSVINNPNLPGASCTFSYSGLSTGSLTAKWGTSRAAYNISSLSPCQGINEKEKESFSLIYPNPFNDKLEIRTSSEFDEVTFTNVLGAVVKRSKGLSTSIDTKDLQQGIYFIRLFDKGKMIGYQKIVKSN